MTDPRDELDTWLSEPVQPLLPPPGAFERIRRQARRRKRKRATLSALAAAAVVAVAAAVPQVITSQLQRQQTASGPLRSPTSARASSATPRPTRHRGLTQLPPGFHPTSVTFAGTNTGWALGYARAGCGPAGASCVAVARTDSYGTSWRAAGAPPAAAAASGAGVSQIRFLGTSNGWAFGPQLWATHDGGRTWRAVPTGGMRVTALEAAGQRVFAVWARCSGSGPDFAAACTTFSLRTATAGSDRWAPVPGASTLSGAGGSAELVLTHTQGYLLAPGQLLSGSTAGGGWAPVAGGAAATPLPCDPGPAQPDGQPSRALLATDQSGLALLCAGPPTAGGAQQKVLYQSADGGRSWRQVGPAPTPGQALSLAGASRATLILATDAGLELSTDGGASWQAAQPSGGAFPAGGFAYVGMTFPLLGVAVPAGPSGHTLWFTHDGGVTWQPSRIP